VRDIGPRSLGKDAIAKLRASWEQGVASGGAGELDMNAIKRRARQRRSATRK